MSKNECRYTGGALDATTVALANKAGRALEQGKNVGCDDGELRVSRHKIGGEGRVVSALEASSSLYEPMLEKHGVVKRDSSLPR
jgi:hypothetical protein